MIFEYITSKHIQKGELAGLDSYLGTIIPARPNDIRVGFALRDIPAGSIVEISFTEEDTKDFKRQSSQELTT